MTDPDPREVAAPYVRLIDEFLAGRLGAGAFAWQYEQGWLAQPGTVAEPLYTALNDLFVVATAWNPSEAAAGDPDSAGSGELIASARTARERLVQLVG